MKNLKKLRLSKNLSQQQLAFRLDLSQQTIYKYENQITEPDIATLIRISDYFNTSVDYRIGNTDNPQKPGNYVETELSEKELAHLRLYRTIPDTAQKLLDNLLSELSQHASK